MRLTACHKPWAVLASPTYNTINGDPNQSAFTVWLVQTLHTHARQLRAPVGEDASLTITVTVL